MPTGTALQSKVCQHELHIFSPDQYYRRSDNSEKNPMSFLSRLPILSLVILVPVIVLSASAPSADTAPEQHSAWRAVEKGEAVVLMRHALAPGIGDPPEFRLDDCSTQRNLSDKGRSQAVAIGMLIRANGIKQASVLTSAWCRCRDTASLLGFGDYTVQSSLNSFFRQYSVAKEQTDRLKRNIVDWIRQTGTARILVTHQVNISALTGEPVGSGESFIVTHKNGEFIVLARVSAPTP